MSAWLRLTTLVLTPMLLTGCLTLSTETTPVVVDTACTAFAPITYSGTGDTPQTVDEIKAHNRAWLAICS